MQSQPPEPDSSKYMKECNTIIVSVFCLVGFIFSFKMPKNYSPKEVAKDLGLEKEYEENKHLFPEEKEESSNKESLIVNIALWILSGSIFGFIWSMQVLNSINKTSEKKANKLLGLLSIVPPLSIVPCLIANKMINEKLDSLGIEHKKHTVIVAIFALTGLNFISLSIIQHKLNKIVDTKVEQPLETASKLA